MSIREALDALVNERRDLSEEESACVMQEIMTGEAAPAQVGAFLVALRLKGETADEVTGMARVMREHSLHVEVEGPLLDTCGTGGDASGTINVSTAAAFVAAGAGARVAKHGNRAMSSACGSADVLEALGARIDLSPEQVADCIRQSGFGFMFAQAFHPAMKHVASIRREIGLRTVFNILGPLTNPAGAQHQVLGVPRADLGPLMAAVLAKLGTKHAMVVHGHGGVDELTLSGSSTVWEIKDEDIRRYDVSVQELLPHGFSDQDEYSAQAIRGGSAEENAHALRAALDGSAHEQLIETVAVNAAAALVAANIAQDLPAGRQLAWDSISSGGAKERLEAFIDISNSFG